MIEVEAKIKISEEDLLRISKLVNIPEYSLQENKFCSLDKGLLRIRYESGKNILTFKGFDQGKIFNSREEIEVEFDNLENLENIFKILGFNFKQYSIAFLDSSSISSFVPWKWQKSI